MKIFKADKYLIGAIVLLVILPLISISCASSAPSTSATNAPASGTEISNPGEIQPIKEMTQEDSQQIAEAFVKNDPTFVFDGMPDTLKTIDSMPVTGIYAWQFTLEFQCRHAGYGDRTGQVLAQAITNHRAVVTVVSSEVQKAVMDGQYDMLKGEMISGTVTPTNPDGPPIDDGITSVQLEFTYDQLLAQKHITQTIEVALPGSLVVTLGSNPTTGFQWQEDAVISDPSILTQYTHQVVESQSDMVGASGKDVFTFKTLAKGTSTIQLQYSRPWEGGEQGEWTVDLTVIVK